MSEAQTSAYLRQTVMYGGEETARGEMIADLWKIAATHTDDISRQRGFVDRYVQGFDKAQPIMPFADNMDEPS